MSNILFLELIRVKRPLLTPDPTSRNFVHNRQYEFWKNGDWPLGNHTSHRINVDENTITIPEDLDTWGEPFPVEPFSITVVDPH